MVEEETPQENFKQYELNYFLPLNLSGEEISDFPNKFNNFLTEIQGKIENIGKLKIQRFAFLIKNHSRGYWGEIKFSADPAKISELEKRLKLEEEILRFSIEAVPPIKQGAELLAKKPKIKTKKPTLPEIKSETKKEKVKLEEIDKKLEEIIGNI
ncbi:MAG: 30S ribosomal protein S6 [Parcubacteria group bacterium CG11_big_fil_rev_8_21_14_0_20_39_14]|nr:MAG: 30S ribosomal protein S6 [Parcubacteria group bacterium CG11_big_fil_rev_8_21_14_0_20_39_14]PIS35113.1 MAG: 30S ribosomal protein S6 [Parcubacteria group bacterium CG08_land_8_20_14_0_20_38_56]